MPKRILETKSNLLKKNSKNLNITQKIPRMKVNMQSVNFTIDRKLVDFTQRNMDKLETYYDKIIDADVYLKVENTSAKENKIAEIRVNIPGDDLVVKKQCRTFEEAIDEATSTLQRALLKRKEKVLDQNLNPKEDGVVLLLLLLVHLVMHRIHLRNQEGNDLGMILCHQ